MRFLLPKDTERIHWTSHAKRKMRQYQLSEKRLKRVLRFPARKEEGVALETCAIMQRSGTKKRPKEIWLMYQIKNKKIRIISAWRYPGISPKRELPIPEDILEELLKEGIIIN